jgi:hypothetical protein
LRVKTPADGDPAQYQLQRSLVLSGSMGVVTLSFAVFSESGLYLQRWHQ